jgi:hypothetical protein
MLKCLPPFYPTMPEIASPVPKLRYGVGEDFTAIGALKAGAEALGRKASYSWLMGIGGAAFRLYWSQDWSLDMANFVTADVVKIAAESIGITAEAHLNEKSEEVWDLLRRSIDAQSPMLSCGLTSPFETCLIVGYQESPRQLRIRGYLDDGDAYSQLDFRPWYGWCHQSFGLMPITTLREGTEPDLPTLIKASLETILRLAGEGRIASRFCPVHNTKHVMISGLDAYIAWAGGISEKPRGDAAHRGFATSLNMNQLIDARTAAQNFLLDLCNRMRPAALLLSRAAEHYAHEVLALKSARQLIPYPQATPERAAERMEKLLADDERRTEYASLLRTAQNEDGEALGWIRKVVEGGLL